MPGFWQRLRRASRATPFARRPLTLEQLEDRRLLSGFGTANVTYHGGPLLQHVQIESVFYGTPWTTTSSLKQLSSQVDGFLKYFPSSAYTNVLKQYNVGTGSFEGALNVAQNPSGGTIDDTQIQQILNSGIASGKVPPPSANQLYVFFTAPNVVVTAGGQNSVNDFAGYHDSFTDSAGAAVYYAVIPYPTGGVANVPLTDFQQDTVILSHEVSESITDPDTQTGWFDPQQGEIGDIAAGQVGKLDGYMVQYVWSQSAGQSVLPTHSSGLNTPTPTPPSGSTLHVAGNAIQATIGQAFSGTVATITGGATTAATASFTATIDWGDKTHSRATITVDPNGGFDVTGTHKYRHQGTYRVTVSVANAHGRLVGKVVDKAHVGVAAPAPPAITASGEYINAASGQSFTGTVATFTDTNASATTGEFTATIDWGDGTVTTGTVTADPNGGFDVTGTHIYASSNSWGFDFGGFPFGSGFGNSQYLVHVTITDTQSQAAVIAVSLATVAPPPPNISANGIDIPATSGQSFTGVVATFTDVNTSAPATEFTASIDWGDGTVTDGTISADPNGGFDVKGTHTYKVYQGTWGSSWGYGFPFGFGNSQFVVQVTVTDNVTQDEAITQSLATVVPTPPSVVVTAQSIQATAGQSFSGAVATFTDADGAGASHFTATIHWGDGTVSTGTVTVNAQGALEVDGAHTYARAGKYRVRISVQDDDGEVEFAKSSATVAGNPAVTAHGHPKTPHHKPSRDWLFSTRNYFH
jgi:hypothetical protein